MGTGVWMKIISVYSRSNCHFCTEAKDHLTNLKIPFVEIDIMADMAARNKIVSEGHKTVPVIYFGEEVVPGGAQVLKTMGRDDILERLQDV